MIIICFLVFTHVFGMPALIYLLRKKKWRSFVWIGSGAAIVSLHYHTCESFFIDWLFLPYETWHALDSYLGIAGTAGMQVLAMPI